MANDDHAWERWRIHRYIGQWGRAVQRQAKRVSANVDDLDAFETDVHLFAVALNQLVTMSEWAKAHAARAGERDLKRAIGGALAMFHQAAPGSDDIRDIHEHMMEYERGYGRLQKIRWLRERPPPLARWYTDDEVNVMGLRLSVSESAAAAAVLAVAVESALGG